MAQARQSLEWAYDALTDEGEQIPPKADRLNWLTCARHLLRHADLAKKIESATYRTVHAEHEEFWRHQFYVALDDMALKSGGYYLNGQLGKISANIEPRSAAVVVAFSSWPSHLVDPTDRVDVDALLAGPDSGLKRGVRDFLDALKQSRAEPEAPKAQADPS